jgi:hypothetical protein
MNYSLVPTAEISLFQNAFFVLGATTRDNQSRIVELTDERSLMVDPDLCQKARSTLTSPRSRLLAELSWFPGVSPGRAEAAVESLKPNGARTNVLDFPPLARANALAARIEGTSIPETHIINTLFSLAAASEEIDAEVVMRDINEDRAIAGVPPVRELDPIYVELAARRRHYRDASRKLMDRLPTKALVNLATELAAKATDGGKKHAPILVEDIVDAYETAAQAFVEGETKNIQELIELVRARAPEGESKILQTVDTICAVLANWNFVIKPVQMASQAKGLEHSASQAIAYQVRSLSVDLYNLHSHADACARLTTCLQREFLFLAEFASRVSEDASTLNDILKAREKAKSDKEEFERSLSFKADIGALFKDPVEISAKGLIWKGYTYRLEDIVSLRWGGTRHSVNGVPTGTTYVISISTGYSSTVINLRNETIYSALVDRLWRGVGVRLLYQLAASLKDGGRLAFPGAIIEDDAVTLTRRHMFKADEYIRATWDQVRLWNSPGCFVIGLGANRSVCANLSYTQTDNVVVLENLMRAFFKSPKPRVSSTFD